MAAYISTNGAPSTPVTNPWSISGTVALGDVVYQVSGIDRTVARAKANDAAKVPPLGVVTGVSGSTVQVAGNGEIATGFANLTPGTVYWLDTVAGQITATKPESNIYLIGVATSVNSILVGFTAASLPNASGSVGTVTSVTVTSADSSLAIGGTNPVTGSGTVTVELNNVAIAQGGTGQTTKTEAFDALAPTTTKGDLIYYNGTDNVRLGVGADNAVLKSNSSTGVPEWNATVPGTVSSVAIQNTDGYITVTGSPVTTSGTIDISLNVPVPVVKGGTGLTANAEQGALLYGDSSGGYTSQNVFPYMRNRVINGNMVVAQRGTAAVTSDSAFAVDRWPVYNTTAATFTAQQSSVAPTGFTQSYLLTVGSGASSTAAQYAQIQQKIEGSNVYDLAFGTASAKTITLSFWVRSSVAGTYCVSLRNSLPDRSYVTTYAIAAANTWEKKSIVIPGDTSGTWATDTQAALRITYDLGSGSAIQTSTLNAWQNGNYYSNSTQANVIGTTGATFYLTGVQLEVGTVATPFEWRQAQTELALCQRYYARLAGFSGNYVGFGSGHATSTTAGYAFIKYPVTMRGYPTVAFSNVAVYDTAARAATAGATQYGLDTCRVAIAATGLTLGYGFVLCGNNNAAAYVSLDAEL